MKKITFSLLFFCFSTMVICQVPQLHVDGHTLLDGLNTFDPLKIINAQNVGLTIENSGDKAFYAFMNNGHGFYSEDNMFDGFNSRSNGTTGYNAEYNPIGFYGVLNSQYGFFASANPNGFYASTNTTHGYVAINNTFDGFNSRSNGTTGYNAELNPIGFYASTNTTHGFFSIDNTFDGFNSRANGTTGYNAESNPIGFYGVLNTQYGFFASANPEGYRADQNTGFGFHALNNGTDGIYSVGNTGKAAYFSGDVEITNGTLTKPSGSFKIDHPLDPENKFLYHSFAESPDMLNIYNGNIVLDATGEAIVELPDWFESLNMDCKYQLTCIGGWAQVFIKEKISNNSFKIGGGTPGLEVSWQVTGIRNDPYAKRNRIQVEVEKPTEYKGQYLHPQVYDLPFSKGFDYIKLGSKLLENVKDEPNKRK